MDNQAEILQKSVMHKRIWAVTLAVFLSIHGIGNAAKKPSKLSEFVGDYSGTMILSSSGTAAVGTAQGHISASKKKETGTISLSSVLTASSTTIIWAETYGLRNKSLTYLLNASGTIGSGSGRAGVSKKAINFSGTFVVGSTVFSFSGTLRKSGRSIHISETLISTGATIVVTYDLKKRGKK